MLDLFTGKVVMRALEMRGFTTLTLEEVIQMSLVPKAGNEGDCTIFAIQRSNLTIMVWLQYDARHGVKVKDVKKLTW